MQEFHIHRKIRDQYALDSSLFETDGNLIFLNVQAVHKFVKTLNSKLDPAAREEKKYTSGQIYAMGLIDEILHFVFHQYRKDVYPNALYDAYSSLLKHLGQEKMYQLLSSFCDEYPPVAVYLHKVSVAEYLGTDKNRLETLEEIILLWLANANPAFMQYGEFFDDATLQKTTSYLSAIEYLRTFFSMQPVYGPDHQDLLTLLRSPAIAAPYSLQDQLKYIRERWSYLLKDLLLKLLGGLDLIQEELKAIFAGPGPAFPPDYRKLTSLYDLELERFSPDSDWMPRVVLMAKNTYVWLFQLSQQYHREIRTLDQIPDAELDRLAQAGFSGLWLIGLWERSPASENIKKLCGNPEAVASAYSISEYHIAQDLGGDAALQNLKFRAWQRGIRLASDMVPNHMGIDSSWVTYQPDDFVGLDNPPFPAYTFNGINLSRDPGIGIYIEDHYYDRTDAAVVFKWTEFSSGHTRYIYHGNDGTNMPWNDTAQLNYLSEAVREKVIQQILNVARTFPIIRFDAAMTLARKHYQRLWFPEPGSGGDIPSRSQFALTRQKFEEVFPREFWRDVVDRVAAEVPDTLLLAEAFWLMEGYFVRTLGMHRVYNSAFMNMMRNEDNSNYRALIKNTLEFDPEILQRFVNFMNNPDEKTAVDQFGKGDKYFGICLMMSTLPGLPMFGHGQVEGYSEKYGMEYRRAYLQEYPDQDLITRHQHQIFPLLHRREIFAGAEQFRLYDFYAASGTVNEDVYAYSNGVGGNRGLVIYHNRYATTSGWVKLSSAYLDKHSGKLSQTSLADNLGLYNSTSHFVILRDRYNGREYLRNAADLHRDGLYLQLDAYQAYAFTDIEQVEEDAYGNWRRLHDELNGRPEKDVREEYHLIRYRSILKKFEEMIAPDNLRILTSGNDFPSQWKVFSGRLAAFLNEYGWMKNISVDMQEKVISTVKVSILHHREMCLNRPPALFKASKTYQQSLKRMAFSQLDEVSLLVNWLLILYAHLPAIAPDLTAERGQYQIPLQITLKRGLQNRGLTEFDADRAILQMNSIFEDCALLQGLATQPVQFWIGMFENTTRRQLLGINEAQGTRWYVREKTQFYLLLLERSILLFADAHAPEWTISFEHCILAIRAIQKALANIDASEYKVDKLLLLLNEERK